MPRSTRSTSLPLPITKILSTLRIESKVRLRLHLTWSYQYKRPSLILLEINFTPKTFLQACNLPFCNHKSNWTQFIGNLLKGRREAIKIETIFILLVNIPLAFMFNKFAIKRNLLATNSLTILQLQIGLVASYKFHYVDILRNISWISIHISRTFLFIHPNDETITSLIVPNFLVTKYIISYASTDQQTKNRIYTKPFNPHSTAYLQHNIKSSNS